MKLLVCVDGSSQSMKAVVKAVEIASGCQINQVTILGVLEKHLDTSIQEGSNPNEIIEEIKKEKRLTEQLLIRHEKYLEHAAMRFREKGIISQTVIKEGRPADAIYEFALEGDFDMIIMGSHGQGNIKNLLLGSVSNEVIHKTKSSVLVVK